MCELRVHGVTGLRVVDALVCMYVCVCVCVCELRVHGVTHAHAHTQVMPRIPGGQTASSTFMVAEKV